jgi:hypothetical protein
MEEKNRGRTEERKKERERERGGGEREISHNGHTKSDQLKIAKCAILKAKSPDGSVVMVRLRVTTLTQISFEG